MLFLKKTAKAQDKQSPLKTMEYSGRHLRHELKYMLDEGTYRVLRGRLLPLMYHDRNGENGEYRVTSLYFDDIYRSAYIDKTNGVLTRRKFRVRSYNLDPTHITLEAKHKDGEFVSKLSQRLTMEQYRALLAGDCGFMKDCEDEENAFGEYYRSDRLVALKPRVIVDYQREALIYPFGNVRITFDKKLSTCYNGIDMFEKGAFFSPIYPKEIILEVKFDEYIPDSIQSVLHGTASQQSVSKYILCCDKLTEVKTYGI